MPYNSLISSTQVTKHCSFQAKNLYLQLSQTSKDFIFLKCLGIHAWFITSKNQFTDIPASGQDSAFMEEVKARKLIFLKMDTIVWNAWWFWRETITIPWNCAIQQNNSTLVAAQNSDNVTRKLDSIPAQSRNFCISSDKSKPEYKVINIFYSFWTQM